MRVTERIYNSWTVIALEGKFIVKNLTKIRRYFDRAVHRSHPDVAIDMGEVSQLDSSAVTILVNFQRRIVQNDGRLVLFGMNDDIAEIFSIVGIDKIFRICRNREDFEELYGHRKS